MSSNQNDTQLDYDPTPMTDEEVQAALAADAAHNAAIDARSDN